VTAERNAGNAPLVVLGMRIARVLPKRTGYWLGRQVAALVAHRQIRAFRVLRENLSHVVTGLSEDEANALAHRAMQELAYSYFDGFSISQQELRQGNVLQYDAEEWARVQQEFLDSRGTIVVGAHVGSFDLAIQWIADQGYEVQVLSLANPERGTQVVNRYRQKGAVIVTPVSLQSLREATRRLRAGGVVATGIDRPINYDDPGIPFFGSPAPLPTGHIRLALQSDARIIVACCLREGEHTYRVRFWPALDMIKSGNRDADVMLNARRVLEVIEQIILIDPAQWGMLHPVWSRPASIEQQA